ncbi:MULTISPECIES: hypothetical protein [unclassified Streptomyces]|uniref:hypothetical protein n=1 Tax=unclassified Streptomyces TaxID=2593676 RepID=UPI0033A4A450
MRARTGWRAAELRHASRITLFGSVYAQVIRIQRLYQEATGQGQRVIAPVTDRGDAVGLLELLPPTAPGGDALGVARKPPTRRPTS